MKKEFSNDCAAGAILIDLSFMIGHATTLAPSCTNRNRHNPGQWITGLPEAV